MTAAPPPSSPRLSASGYATIYLTVLPGLFGSEHGHATSVLRQKKKEEDPFEGIVSPTPEILYLLGQARLAARVEATDYRSVLHRAYPDRASHALVSNAVFSIPYEREIQKQFTHSRADPGMLRFLTHLRVRRTIYAKEPVLAESLIIERLRELSDKLDGETTIEAGLGWADFIISGVFHPNNFNEFLKNLVEFNRVTIDDPAIDDRHCVFRRSLTLLGYAWTGPDSAPLISGNLKALMFIRARPGHLSKVESLVHDRFPTATIEFVDGKIDVIATIADVTDFFRQHELLSEQTGHRSIEKFETHLVFGSNLFKVWSSGTDDGGAEQACGCETVDHPICDIDNLPKRLHNAVKNIEFLFSATMRDPANCCDARSGVLACEQTLKRLIAKKILDTVIANDGEPQSDSPNARVQAVLDERNSEEHRRIDQWVRTSERILRQRTVGSFEEFLGQSDRAVSYRGGAQKVLTVADNLMNDFYAKITRLKNPEAYFTSLYDSADGVEIIIGTGFVRLPVRALFFLPGVVPDLWHEVGSYQFFRTIDSEDHFDLDLAQPRDKALYEHLADHYGDLISFVYGFKLDKTQFATALVEGWLAAQVDKEVPPRIRELSYAHIIVRIVAVFEFLLIKEKPLPIARPDVLAACYQKVLQVVGEYSGSTRVPQPTDDMWKHVYGILTAPELAGRLEYVRECISIDDFRAALNAPERAAEGSFEFGTPATLRSFTADSDLNDEFRALYWAVMKQLLATGERTKAFAHTAALIRGTALEYHKRAVARDEATRKSRLPK